MRPRPAAPLLLAALLATAPAAAAARDAAEGAWKELSPGLELATLPLGTGPAVPADGVTILRIDPARFHLVVRGIGASGGEGATARGWCEREGLVAAINAGMFDIDYRTHIGYLRDGDHRNNGRRNRYLSAAAFNPTRPGGAPFRIFDLDETAFEEVDAAYRTVIQNLRVVRRPGISVWKTAGRRWSEAALGEDSSGRALFLFSRRPVAMGEFADRLLDLPIGLVALQHLEGGAQAQLYVKAGGTSLELTGAAGGGADLGETGVAWPIPTVIGITAPGR